MEETIKLILEKLEILDQRLNNLENGQTNLNQKLINLEQGQVQLSEGQKRLEKGQEEIKDHLIQLETKNANRHLEINNNLEKLARDLTTLESVAGKNLIDIATLKSVK